MIIANHPPVLHGCMETTQIISSEYTNLNLLIIDNNYEKKPYQLFGVVSNLFH